MNKNPPKSVKKAIEDNAPWRPPKYELADVSAIQALLAGNANADQQKRAMDWIIYRCCRTYDMSYRPDSERETVFAEGKRYVGNAIVRMTRTSIAMLRGEKNSEQP